MRPNQITIDSPHTGFQREVQAAWAESHAPSSLCLPDGLDTEIFDQEQLEYLADFYQSEVLRHLRLFYSLLRAVPAGAEPTLQSVGINAALLGKLFALSDELADMPRDAIARALHVRKATLVEQFHAVAEAIRKHHPRAARQLK